MRSTFFLASGKKIKPWTAIFNYAAMFLLCQRSVYFVFSSGTTQLLLFLGFLPLIPFQNSNSTSK